MRGGRNQRVFFPLRLTQTVAWCSRVTLGGFVQCDADVKTTTLTHSFFGQVFLPWKDFVNEAACASFMRTQRVRHSECCSPLFTLVRAAICVLVQTPISHLRVVRCGNLGDTRKLISLKTGPPIEFVTLLMRLLPRQCHKELRSVRRRLLRDDDKKFVLLIHHAVVRLMLSHRHIGSASSCRSSVINDSLTASD